MQTLKAPHKHAYTYYLASSNDGKYLASANVKEIIIWRYEGIDLD